VSVASAANNLLSRLTLAAAWTAFSVLRGCERLLPLSVLSLLLWPPAVIWDLIHLRPRNPFLRWRAFPKSWQPPRWRFVLRQSLGLFHAQFLSFWPDRLSTARWLGRCRIEGRNNLVEAEARNRAVVFACLHFGPFEVIPYWLRAHGIVTTSVRTPRPKSLKSLIDYQYSLSPPADVPVFLLTTDLIPMPRVAHFRKILGPGGRLLVMVDVDRGAQVTLPFEDRVFRMATGAAQLALLGDAELIPCLIAETAAWRFVIHFGAPTPRQYLTNPPNMQAIAPHLLAEFSKFVTQYSTQCKHRLLRALLPAAITEIAKQPESH
jgi:lauroyl/myristoyl acyltransferase